MNLGPALLKPAKPITMKNSIFTKVILALIYFYQKVLSPMKKVFFGHNAGCRFYPCCSEYSRLSFIKHGFLKGFYLTIGRVFRCHPFHLGGYDPVPKGFKFFKIRGSASRSNQN